MSNHTVQRTTRGLAPHHCTTVSSCPVPVSVTLFCSAYTPLCNIKHGHSFAHNRCVSQLPEATCLGAACELPCGCHTQLKEKAEGCSCILIVVVYPVENLIGIWALCIEVCCLLKLMLSSHRKHGLLLLHSHKLSVVLFIRITWLHYGKSFDHSCICYNNL